MDATGEWRTIQVPGSFPAVRVLDNRVAITLRTAWNQRPRFVRGKFMLSDLQRRYEESEYEYPGTLLVYDPAAGQTWELQTGHSDSEILLIRGDELYYRIHTKLIRARLSPGGTVKTEQVLADRPEIAEMHWAFFGPATSQPVEGVKARVQKPAPSPKVPRVVNEMPPGIYFEYYTGDLPEPSIKSLHPLIIQNGWQVWFLRNQRMPELTDYLIGPFADEDEIDLVKEKFKEGNLNLRRRKFPEAVPLP